MGLNLDVSLQNLLLILRDSVAAATNITNCVMVLDWELSITDGLFPVYLAIVKFKIIVPSLINRWYLYIIYEK